MPGFQDSAFLIVLALLLFGPKKLPQLARQAGKLMADFRRASNEFRTQMEEELRISEQADRQKQVAAIEAAKPVVPAIEPPVPDPSLSDPALPAPDSASSSESPSPYMVDSEYDIPEPSIASAVEPEPDSAPIATSGDLSMLPPASGLPVANSVPETFPDVETVRTEHLDSPARESEYETETLHG